MDGKENRLAFYLPTWLTVFFINPFVVLAF